jgi:O-acetyl-ADP-ribose deacetylase (regulator of RNase III)/ADP-ribose pyrophosphatase YjhB (NUDIX family)
MKIKNTEIKVIRADITELKVDAIINAANNKLVMGGGVAGAIRKKGGQGIEDEAVKKGPIKIGEAVATGAGKLAVRYVIHAATMVMDFATDEIKIRDSARSALKVAEELKINSLAFPALGCGVGGFPLIAAAKIMSQEVLRHLRENDSTLKEIFFCLYDQEAYEVFQKNALDYLDYIVNKLKSPYVTVDAIIELSTGVVIIERHNPPFGWALPGGFVDYGESLEEAVKREAKEETGLDITEIKQFHTYSNPQRDPRFHTIGTVFIAQGNGKPRAGDDAKDLKIVELNELQKYNFAFDHAQILEDYVKHKEGKTVFLRKDKDKSRNGR